MKPLVWTKFDPMNFPEQGIFGKTKEWFTDHDIAYVTSFDGEDLILMQGMYHGFPDPPEWGLASRAAGQHGTAWEHWGHFAVLPVAWKLGNTGEKSA